MPPILQLAISTLGSEHSTKTILGYVVLYATQYLTGQGESKQLDALW